MKTYTLKLKLGYSSVRYLMYDDENTQLTTEQVSELFFTDGSAYIVFDYRGGSVPSNSDVRIADPNSTTDLIRFPQKSDGFLSEDAIYKITWRGRTTQYTTYHEIDTFVKLDTSQAYGFTEVQFSRIIDKIKEGKIIVASSAPTSSTEGTVGQTYIDTSTGDVYYLSEIDETTTPTTYTWEKFGGTIYDSTISLTNNGSALDSFTVNASANKTIALNYPVITMSSTDPGEGAPLAANNFIAYYE